MPVYRVYTEKMAPYAVEAQALLSELRTVLLIPGIASLRILNRYDIENIAQPLFAQALPTVFAEPQLDAHTFTLTPPAGAAVFDGEPLPGQFDARAASCEECIQLISQGERPTVRTARVFILTGDISPAELARVKAHLINPVEAREASLAEVQTIAQPFDAPADVAVLHGFTQLDADGLAAFLHEHALAMDADDLACCRDYFRTERRDPTMTEIRMLDTYWSDHCRHTTFLTTLQNVTFDQPAVQAAFARYLAIRAELGRENKPVNLMDVATIGARALKARGGLANLDESEEINACSIRVTVDVDGRPEPWLLMFKNETHNHPTEIEPFGGAATCIGGAIRDPLSGRTYVYQAMRVTGAADPLVPVADTLPGKLPQRKLVTTAAAGYSAYGNQIGLATGLVDELYHPGYAAKRMEIGAVVGAAPLANIRREAPSPGDVIILLGGRTGRDGCGGATGSSKSHSLQSLQTCGAEVQKGNPVTERKLQRLFRDPAVTRLIKRCNDFGAGGVSVAIGELADGLRIDLDRVPKKYEGLSGTELAISESQERMAVVVAPADAAAFIALAAAENLEATQVAVVTAEPRLTMLWRGQPIVDIHRDFLNSNGAEKQATAHVAQGGHASPAGGEPIVENPGAGVERSAGDAPADAPAAMAGDAPADAPAAMAGDDPAAQTLTRRLTAMAGSLPFCSRQGLSERFDATIGAGTVLMPFGGRHQLTPAQGMVAKLPVLHGQTDTASCMAYGFHPELMVQDAYRGAYLSVAESLARLAATGFDARKAYLTFQEYFPRTGTDPLRWGQPLAALLGALDAQMGFGIAAIGGKDSMSGTFEQLTVPPTLVSFAIAPGTTGEAVSPEFKAAGHSLYYLPGDPFQPGAFMETLDFLHSLNRAGLVTSAWAVGLGGVAEGLFKMALGNRIGAAVDAAFARDLFAPAIGGLIVAVAEPAQGAHPALLAALATRAERLGVTTEAYTLACRGETVPLAAVQEAYEAKLEPVFPYRRAGGAAQATGTEPPATHSAVQSDVQSAAAFAVQPGAQATKYSAVQYDVQTATVSAATTAAQTPAAVAPAANTLALPPYAATQWGKPALRTAQPMAVIPTFPGTNCEVDTARALERAGAKAKIVLIQNLTADHIRRSVDAVGKAIGGAQMVVFPGGFSGGDEPDGSGKFITAFFRNPAMKAALHALLQDRDGLMLGICNGFQALIKLGLVPFGTIVDTDEHCPTLTFNTIGRHQSMLVRTRVVSNKSPWLQRCAVGDVHLIPVSHGEGRFVCEDGMLAKLAANGQVCTQYVDADGQPGMDVRVNPNGSLLAVEGICSPDGRVLGKMGHSERTGRGLYQNVPGNILQPLLEGGVAYFR
ncbi:MAG: phosphoribosylformylglycinamidine synthase subunit PurQ [Candidatus Limiplasma sp.]|nr:phosphoribosylformylglycinamidine synthase subunit PurQ [Candidatus Limiplasma sp.]